MTPSNAPAWPALALGAAALAVFSSLVRAYWPFTVDDTFIFLRYAQNLAAGHGLTYNPGGPPAEGYTSVSWTVLLALPHLAGLDAETFAKAAGVACMLGAAALAAHLASRLSGDRRLAPAVALVLVLALPATAVHAVSGMETALATLLVALWAVCAERLLGGRGTAWPLAATGLALGLTRPEANLFVAAGLLLVLEQLDAKARRRLALATLAAHVAPGALYFGWRAVHYGKLLPLPFYVKTLANDLVPLAGLKQCVELLRMFTVDNLWLCALLVVALATSRFARLALAAAATWWAFFLFPRHEMGFDLRYLFPLVPLLLAFCAAAVPVVLQRLGGRVSGAWAALGVAVLMAASFYSRLEGHVAEKRDYGNGGRKAHVAIGRWLASIRERVARPVVATLDAGAIAYYAGWNVIDTWGLNDPEVAVAAASTGRSADAILARQPSVVIVISQHADRFEPHFDYEGPLYETALARGYRVLGRWEFLPDYHLWALGLEGVPAP